MLAWFSIARPCLPTAPNGRSREGVSETSRAPLGQNMTKLAAEWSWAYASRIREVGWNLIFKERPNSRQTERACCIYTSVQ